MHHKRGQMSVGFVVVVVGLKKTDSHINFNVYVKCGQFLSSDLMRFT